MSTSMLASMIYPALLHAGVAPADVGALSPAARLTRIGPDRPEIRVPFGATADLWERAARRAGDPLFGIHCALRPLPSGTLSVIGFLVRTSPDLGTAFQRTIRFKRLVDELGRVELMEQPGAWSFTHKERTSARHFIEAIFARFVVVAREATETPFSPTEVHFAHAPPAEAHEVEAVFGCPVRYRADKNRMVLSTAALSARVVSTAPALDVLLNGQMSEVRERLVAERGTGLLERLIVLVSERLPDGGPSIQQAARELGFSARTLQRRLADEGTSFIETVDALRRAVSLRLLEDSRLAIHDVSMLLGFSEPKAFRRAFRRWHGCSPRQHRAGLQTAGVA